MTNSAVRHLDVLGAFDLGQSVRFGFGQREASEDEVMRLAFVVDGGGRQVGVAVRQVAVGRLELEITSAGAVGPDVGAARVGQVGGLISVEERAADRDAADPEGAGPPVVEPDAVEPGAADPDVVARQVARVLSVDVDAREWDALGAREPLLGRLQAARPGLRPPLFYSAYEALAWCVLSARRPHQQMAALRDRLSAERGALIEVAGRPQAAFPTPRQLLAVSEFPGLPEVKLRRLRGVARAALDGLLDTADLRALPPAVAAARLRTLEGIGPLYAELVVIRALGHTDVIPTAEPKVLEVAGRLLDRAGPLLPAEFEELVRAWTPWRTWASVAIRAAGPLLL